MVWITIQDYEVSYINASRRYRFGYGDQSAATNINLGHTRQVRLASLQDEMLKEFLPALRTN